MSSWSCIALMEHFFRIRLESLNARSCGSFFFFHCFWISFDSSFSADKRIFPSKAIVARSVLSFSFSL